MSFSNVTTSIDRTQPSPLFRLVDDLQKTTQTYSINKPRFSPEKVKKIALGILLTCCLISSIAISAGASTPILIGIIGTAAVVTTVIIGLALVILYRETKRDKLIRRTFFNNTCTPSEAVLNELNRFPECSALIKEANEVIDRCKLPPLEIRFEKTKSGFDAEQDKNIIRIKPEQSAGNILSYAIFEIRNLTQHEKFLAVNKNFFNGVYKTAEEYTRANEFIEFHSGIRRNHITSKINKMIPRYFRHYMKNEYEILPLESLGFNIYYKWFLATRHKEYYRKFWREKQPEVAKYQAEWAKYEADKARYDAQEAEYKAVCDRCNEDAKKTLETLQSMNFDLDSDSEGETPVIVSNDK